MRRGKAEPYLGVRVREAREQPCEPERPARGRHLGREALAQSVRPPGGALAVGRAGGGGGVCWVGRVRVDVLAEESHLLDAGGSELRNLTRDGVGVARSLTPAREGDDAVRAHVVATTHDGNLKRRQRSQ